MLPRLSRRWRTAGSLKPGDYVHTPVAGYRIISVGHIPGSVAIEAALDSGTPMFVTHPAGRSLDVTRTFRGLRRFMPAS
ncbi:hypothetical protein AB0F17_28545 [Nonomuraea sp. NPDC026600]|uniref:hypothetical protein n=1 Tax=Nonomuraea sp. NPDC026600 TaxID=3155363 RepID=UPI0033E7CBBA